jgi:hypothetical protein
MGRQGRLHGSWKFDLMEVDTMNLEEHFDGTKNKQMLSYGDFYFIIP